METKVCSNCNKNMIKEYSNTILLSSPAQYPYEWWCACGYKEDGGVERGETKHEKFMRRWNDAQ